MPPISELLRSAEQILTAAGIAEPRREAFTLLTIAASKDKTFLYAHPEHVLAQPDTFAFESFVRRRATREPLQYISGVQEFYGLEFEVTPDVLIPRPETEVLVEHAINLIGEIEQAALCEVGVGSGCIAISILHSAKSATAIGLDVSDAALAVARRNAERHSVASRLELRQSNVFDELADQKFNLILSNPPYVPATDIDGLEPEVRDFEPRLALTDGSNGLSIISRIVNGAPGHLSPSGHLLIEIGFDQSEQVRIMFDPSLWQPPVFLPDLQGIPRVIAAKCSDRT
jgi:release factor glutamine methyltransferase